MNTDKVFKMMNRLLITPRFLSLVEKWARYDGEEFSIGDLDVYVTNKGTFTITSESPKLIFSKGMDFTVSKTETDTHIETFDVTEIYNSCVCSNYDRRIVIAQRYEDWMSEDYRKSHPAKLFIYAIFNEEKADNTQYTGKPTFERLKKDFESKTFTHYNNLLHDFCGNYSLVPFNDATDRIFNFTGIQSDLEWLELEDESKELSAHIKIIPRLTEKQREIAREKIVAAMEKKTKDKKK